MIDSSLSKPSREKYRTYKKSHIEFCKGNICAAGIIDLFDKLYVQVLHRKEENKKENEIAEAHGDSGTQPVHLLKAITIPDFKMYLMEMFSDKTIRMALKFLISKKIISTHKNPNPRYRFDKRNHYQFHPEVFNAWLERKPRSEETPNMEDLPHRDGKKGKEAPCLENLPHRSGKKDRGTLSILPLDPSKFTSAIYKQDKKQDKKAEEEEREEGEWQNGKTDTAKMNVAADLFESEVSIGESLTSTQKVILEKKLQRCQNKLPKSFSNYGLKDLCQSVELELLNTRSFVKCVQDFNHKLNVILQQATLGQWDPSMPKRKRLVAENQKAESNLKKLQGEVREFQQEWRGLCYSLEQFVEYDPQNEALIDSFKRNIRTIEAEIDSRKKSIEKIEQSINEGTNHEES